MTAPLPPTASLSRQALIEQTLAEHRGYEIDGRQALFNAATAVDRVARKSKRHPKTRAVLLSVVEDLRAAALAALDAPQGGDEARLTEAEEEALAKAARAVWAVEEVIAAVERILADRLAAPRDQAGDTLAEAAERVNATHHFHGEQCLCGFSSAVSRVRTEHITGTLRALLAAQPVATASEEDQR